jgi:TonB-dependent starch-binding outer membrane protein SusC
MKLTIIIIMLTTLQISARSYSQNTRVSMEISNGTVTDVFKEIENQSDFRVFYKVDQVDLKRKLNYSADRVKISDVLKTVLPAAGVSYEVIDKVIVITKAAAEQPEQKVSGTVIDASTGQSLPGVNIVIKGTSRGTATDSEGKYLLEIPGSGTVLVFSYIGYLTQEISVGDKKIVNVALSEDIKKLDEVVVVGYGTVKRSDVTGAVTKISEKVIKERPVENAIQAIQGKLAGVDIVTNVRPGEVASINIRGTRSISGSNSPLFVIDGIILMGSINDINPKDISSMEVLKDASATAIYGSRGANGVVLITTKKGTKGKLSVNYDGTLSFDNIHSTTDWASAGEALDRTRLAEINGGTYKLGTTAISYPDPSADIIRFGNSDVATLNAIRQGYSWNDPGIYSSVTTRPSTAAELAKGWPAQVPVYNVGNIPSTDWIDILTKQSVTHNHQLSFSAGTENSRLYLSFGYLNNDGTQMNQYFKRYNIKMNGEINPMKWLSVGTSVNATFSTQEYGTINRTGSATGPQDSYGMALSQYPLAAPYDATGAMIINPGNNKAAPIWNPFIDLMNSRDERRNMNISGNLFSEVKFTSWLKYRLNFGSNFRYGRTGAWQGTQSTTRRLATPQTAAASYATSDNFQYMIENLIFLDKSFGVHTFGLTLLQSAQSNRNESSSISASGITNDAPLWYDLSANNSSTGPSSYGTNYSKNTLVSYMARVNYSLMNKYLLTASGRYDGASVLAEGNKWDFFPSAAIAWKMQEENFVKNIKWINELKLRLGYGVTGNSAVGAYTTSGPLSKYNYVFNTASAIGYNPYSMPNPTLKWEKTAQTNIGLDFAFLANRITGTIELYQSNTSNILMVRDIPSIIGYPNITDNIGKMRNRGIEVTLSTVNIQNRDFRWSTDLNWTKNKEEITELVNGNQDMKGNLWFIGQPLQVFRTYEVAGLWQNTPEDLAEIALWKANSYNFAPGQYKPVEQGTPNHKLEDDDKVIRGTVRPKWVGGFTNTFGYKNFELSSFIYARVGQKYFSSLQPGGSTGGSYIVYMRSMDTTNFWSTTSTDAEWPKLTSATGVSNDDVKRATFINDGSFVVIRNIALSYNFPQELARVFHVKGLQVYGQVLNPFIFGGKVIKAGINPDDSNGWTNVNSVGDPTGGANNNTMIIKSWVLGARVDF